MAAAGVSAIQAATWAAVFTVRVGTKMVSYRTVSASGVSSARSTQRASGSRAARMAGTSSMAAALRDRSTR